MRSRGGNGRAGCTRNKVRFGIRGSLPRLISTVKPGKPPLQPEENHDAL